MRTRTSHLASDPYHYLRDIGVDLMRSQNPECDDPRRMTEMGKEVGGEVERERANAEGENEAGDSISEAPGMGPLILMRFAAAHFRLWNRSHSHPLNYSLSLTHTFPQCRFEGPQGLALPSQVRSLALSRLFHLSSSFRLQFYHEFIIFVVT